MIRPAASLLSLVAGLAILVPVARAQNPGAAGVLPATLAPVIEELRTTLALTDAQSADVSRLLVQQAGRATSIMDRARNLNLEAVIDLLVTARAIRDEFLPQLSAVLTEEQKARLQALPRSSSVYVSAMAGWLAEARLNTLQGVLRLNDTQVPGVRQVLLDQFRTMTRALMGVAGGGAGATSTSAILDVLVDLRAAQRMSRRSIQEILTPEQVRSLEAWEAQGRPPGGL
jgi:Spy/CpxP family protein refolding chaperone